jgi:hypothetical protein
MTNSEERAISLKLKNCHTNPGSLVIVFRSGTQSDPCISSVATSIMITSSHSPLQGAGRPINYSVFDCTPWRFQGCPACEPNLVNCS